MEKEYYNEEYVKAPTPLYDQFKLFFARVSAHSGDIDPQALYAEAFEKYVTTLIDKAKEK